ncbi:MAG: glycoside hydrolase family 125 protein [Clostridia bacterium]
MSNYQVTGNEYLSLPKLNEETACVEGLTLLHMGAKGLLELRGDAEQVFLEPILTINKEPIRIQNPQWIRENYWLPSFIHQSEKAAFHATYLCPINERAFFLHMSVTNLSGEPLEITMGVKGRWAQTLHEINETAVLDNRRTQEKSDWNHAFVMQEFVGLPLCAFAPIATQTVSWHFGNASYEGTQTAVLTPCETAEADFIFGIGYETVAAATSAKHLLRIGYERARADTLHWLSERTLDVPDPKIKQLLNTNLFFSFFYASGKTLDTEEFCLMTSRSPRYYVSAAYWDRDSLLWSFPAIVLTDTVYAREILYYVFEKQMRNVGMHSRYIDGTLLEPGFELDELCAPVIALERYIARSGDRSFLTIPIVQSGLKRILNLLKTKKHPKEDLYETFLQPTDDEVVYPYLTYDNVLVWRALTLLADYVAQKELLDQAQRVRNAILAHCVRDGQFIWSTDLNGHFDIYDEPPGSLQLLPFYGFCEETDPLWQKTMRTIRSDAYRFSFSSKPIAEIGCLHAPHPWVLSIANSLLSGHKASALKHLYLTELDNGVACESVNENTGVCETGEAFATCAGFLSFALWTAFC